jgi:hypothetical protein
MTPQELSDFTFTFFNGWVVGTMCLLVALVMLFGAWERQYKRWNRRIKALNWTFLGLVFIADAVLNPPAILIRPWFRIAFFFLLLNELTYHADVILDAAERFWAWCDKKKTQWKEARNGNV